MHIFSTEKIIIQFILIYQLLFPIKFYFSMSLNVILNIISSGYVIFRDIICIIFARFTSLICG